MHTDRIRMSPFFEYLRLHVCSYQFFISQVTYLIATNMNILFQPVNKPLYPLSMYLLDITLHFPTRLPFQAVTQETFCINIFRTGFKAPLGSGEQ